MTGTAHTTELTDLTDLRVDDAPVIPSRGATTPVGVRWRPAVVAVAAYAVLAVAGRTLPAGELFPFFTWDLFSTVPGPTLRAAVYLEEVDGTPVEGGLPLLGSGHVRGHGVVASQLAGRLLQGLQGDPAVAQRAAEALAANHLPPDAAWSLRVEQFDPVERFRDGTATTVEVARFRGSSPVVDEVTVHQRGAVITSAAGRWELVPGGSAGRVERVEPTPGGLAVSGWAGDPTTGALPERLVVLLDGEVLATTSVGGGRGDVVGAHDQPGLLASGFGVVIPGVDRVAPSEVRVVALFADGTARDLGVAS